MAFDFSALIQPAVDLVSSGVSAGAELLGSRMAYTNSKKLARYQADLNYQYAEKSARNSPTWNRAGLESAGYNPMLAVQNGTSGANSSWASPQNFKAPDLSGAISSGVSNALNYQRLKNETEQTESINDKNYAEADEAKARKATLIERLPYVSKQAKADYMKTTMESAKLENDIHYQNEYLNYLDNSLKLEEKLGLMGIATTRRGQDLSYNASTHYTNALKGHYDVIDAKTKRYNDFAEKHPYLTSVGETLERNSWIFDKIDKHLDRRSQRKSKNERSKDYDEDVVHYDSKGNVRSRSRRSRRNH